MRIKYINDQKPSKYLAHTRMNGGVYMCASILFIIIILGGWGEYVGSHMNGANLWYWPLQNCST